ncbi:MAG: hypothetical protein HXY40_13980 [Chloroflexi bacterium]|nr:hypothetical protein [Chloroflexota bacterium]
MPVLLLAQGDVKARDLLKKAISARYGFNPPALESLRIDFKGRARAKVGPITAWVPVEVTASFCFPTKMRWDFTVKPIGVPVQRGVEAFDGQQYRRLRGGGSPVLVKDANALQSMRRRLWSVAALLLTPLGEHFVRLAANDDGSLQATHTQLNDAVNMLLRPDHSLERVQVECVNPDNERAQTFVLKAAETQAPVDGLMLPTKVSTFWDDEPYFEAEPVRVCSDARFQDSLFTLVEEHV